DTPRPGRALGSLGMAGLFAGRRGGAAPGAAGQRAVRAVDRHRGLAGVVPGRALPGRARGACRGAGRIGGRGYNGRSHAPSGVAMPAVTACPQCGLENLYPDGALTVCADCGHEWAAGEQAAAGAGVVVRDVNGNVLEAGDSVVVIKDLKVKGS